MRRVFGITLLLALRSAISFAADATFSKDGKRVYAIEFASPGDKTPHLFDVDIEKQSASKIDLGPLINNKPIVAVSTSNSGDLLAATAQDAWSCNIEKKSGRKLCNAPKGREARENLDKSKRLVGKRQTPGSSRFQIRIQSRQIPGSLCL